MMISSGRLPFEFLSLLLTFRKCCQIARVSFDCLTESEKCLRLAFRIKHFVKLLYFLYSSHNFLRLQASRFLLTRVISSLYQSGNFLEISADFKHTFTVISRSFDFVTRSSSKHTRRPKPCDYNWLHSMFITKFSKVFIKFKISFENHMKQENETKSF